MLFRSAITRAPGAMKRAAVAVSRTVPSVAARLRQAARRASLLPITKRDVDDRLTAARRVFDQIDLFAAPSASIAAEFEWLGIPASKIRVSDYGCAPVPRTVRHPTARTPLRIGYVGTLVWHKGVHVLVDAVRGLPPAAYELKIFGDPGVFPDYTAGLRASAAGLPVRFMGAFDRERTGEVYGQIDVLVVPSLWLENSPLVIHEAFMAGIPVVGARIGGITGLVEEGRSGLLYDPSSPAALEAALRSLIERPARLDELTSARPTIKSIAEDAQEWEATYADVLRRRAAVGQTP